MKNRSKIREFYYYKLQHECEHLINDAFNSVSTSIAEKIDKNSFRLGYICGTDTPTIESLIEASKIINLFQNLSKENQHIIMLMIDGLKYRKQSV